jgi:hypothetical protein
MSNEQIDRKALVGKWDELERQQIWIDAQSDRERYAERQQELDREQTAIELAFVDAPI